MNLPKEWCTDVCPEVIQYLNNKYNESFSGKGQFYGVKNYAWSSNGIFGTYISHKEFMEAIGEHKMKVGDIVWVSDVSEELARKNKEERELLAILPEDITDRRYICRMGISQVSEWYYAVPVVKEERKLRELVLTDSEWEKVQKLYS